ncbi:MAG: hypothetical protein M9927_04250 [Anaerolineae bacterium]|nr:hypothetical protein [Anaerolineae bacterium]
MTNETITIECIDELLEFLPAFEEPNREYIERWAGGTTAAGDLVWPHPVCVSDVMAFSSSPGSRAGATMATALPRRRPCSQRTS